MKKSTTITLMFLSLLTAVGLGYILGHNAVYFLCWQFGLKDSWEMCMNVLYALGACAVLCLILAIIIRATQKRRLSLGISWPSICFIVMAGVCFYTYSSADLFIANKGKNLMLGRNSDKILGLMSPYGIIEVPIADKSLAFEVFDEKSGKHLLAVLEKSTEDDYYAEHDTKLSFYDQWGKMVKCKNIKYSIDSGYTVINLLNDNYGNYHPLSSGTAYSIVNPNPNAVAAVQQPRQQPRHEEYEYEDHNDDCEPAPQQHIPTAHTVDVPMQVWEACYSCNNSGQCRHCLGSGTTPMGYNCVICNSSGRCATCAGTGGRNVIKYVPKTEYY